MSARFPCLKSDGSFSIRLDFEPQALLRATEVDEWLHKWILEKSPWVRLWRGPEGKVVERETLYFMRSFLEKPKCVLSKRDSVVIQLEGRGADPFWKDWMARIVEDSGAELKLKFVRARNSEPA
ncbi:MAG: hypothetical protein GY722_26225 [bacterium]|nr:hypothetical protein [bacterium]